MSGIAKKIAQQMARERFEHEYEKRMGMVKSHYRKGIFSVAELRSGGMRSLIELSESIGKRPGTLSDDPYFPLNDRNRVTDMIRRKEREMLYVHDGLIETYPVDSFVTQYVKEVRKILDEDLLDESISTIQPDYEHPSGEKVTIGTYYKFTKPVRGISSVVEVLVPIPEGGNLEDAIVDISDMIEFFGYTVASVETFGNGTYVSSKGKRFNLYAVALEARFSDYNFSLYRKLFHVSPFRYVHKIEKNGFVPKSKSARFKFPDRVYLFNRNEKADDTRFSKNVFNYMDSKMFGLVQSGLFDPKLDVGMCLFTVDTKKLVESDQYKSGKLKFYADSMMEGTQIDPETSTAVFTYGNIGRGFIGDTYFLYRYDPKTHKRTGVVDEMQLGR